jgi:folate-dependent phosphoribosylglycinamide formyltransferase PurN
MIIGNVPQKVSELGLENVGGPVQFRSGLRLGVFVYDFPHKKSGDGLATILQDGSVPNAVFAAPWQELSFSRPRITISDDEKPSHPAAVAEQLDLPYYILKHNSEECGALIAQEQLDLGVILGARILKGHIISAFKIGVLNLHPGLLPYNRGLDNMQWAIMRDLPQGITAHLIDEHIDRGRSLLRQLVDVYPRDTLLDVHRRLCKTERGMLIPAIELAASRIADRPLPQWDEYNSIFPAEEETRLAEKFEPYRQNYSGIVNKFLRTSQITINSIGVCSSPADSHR